MKNVPYVYLVPILTYTLLANFNSSWLWDYTYYVWDNGKDCFFIYLLMSRAGRHKEMMKPLFVLSVIRMLYNSVVLYFNTGMNSDGLVAFEFLICVMICCNWMCKELFTLYKTKSQQKWERKQS